MAAGDDYRIKAADMNARAKNDRDPMVRAEFENLALAYLRLADQADKNALTDMVYEHAPAQPNVQQQQQPQPDKDND
jgi:hypothetical protein